MAITRITKGVINPNENYDTHNINSTGIITAVSFVGDASGLTGVASTDNIITGTAATFNTYPVDINAGMTVAGVATFAGNVSIAGTLTYEDVTNIDSVGLITARDGIFLADSKKAMFGNTAADPDLEIYHGGTASYISHSGTGNLFIHSDTVAIRKQNQQAYFVGVNGQSKLYESGSERLVTTDKGITVGTGVTIETSGQAEIAGITTFYKDVHIKSGTNRLYLGTGNRLSLIADPSHSYLRNAGTGSHFQIHSDNFSIRSHQGNGSITLFYSPVSDGNEGGGPRLFHNHGAGLILERLRTTKSGVNIVGTTTTTQLAVTGVSTFTGTLNANQLNFGDSNGSSTNIALFGDGNDLKIYHNGNHSILQETGGGGLLVLGSFVEIGTASGSEKYFRAVENGAAELYHNNAKKIETTSTGIKVDGDIRVGNSSALSIKNDNASETLAAFNNDGSVQLFYDNSQKLGTAGWGVQINGILKVLDSTDSSGATNNLTVGTGSDLKIYHDGSQSYLKDYSNQLNIRADNAIKFATSNGSETYAKFIQNGAVELYHDNAKTLETYANGIKVTDGDTDVHLELVSSSGSNGSLYGIDGTKLVLLTSSNEYAVECIKDGAVNLYHNGSKKFETTSSGATVTGALTASTLIGTNSVTSNNNMYLNSDSGKLNIGTGNDLQLFHNGSNSYIQDNGTGALLIGSGNSSGAGVYIRGKHGEESIIANSNGSVELYYDNSKKLETSSTGISVTGGAVLTSTDTGSSAEPEFVLYRNSASPADADYLGQIKFNGKSDTGAQRTYAKMTGKILDASNGTEDGIIEFAHIKAGSQNISARFRSDSLQLLNGTSLTVDGSLDVDGQTDLDVLNVSDTATFSGRVTIATHTHFNFGSNNDNYITQGSSGNTYFRTSSDTFLQINNSGHLLPYTDSTYDLGTSSKRFRNFYADTLYGDGSNLTGISGVTINNNADNRLITGSGTANTLNGESNLTFDGTQLSVTGSGTPPVYIGGANPGIKFEDTNASGTPISYIYASDGQLSLRADDGNETGSSHIEFKVDGSERLRIESGGTLFSKSPSDATPNFKFISDDTNWHGYLNQTVHGGTISSILSCGGTWTVDGTTYAATKDYNGSFGTAALIVHNQYNSTATGGELVFVTKANGSSTTDGAVTERLRIASDGKLTVAGTGAMKIPSGTTAQRPGSSVTGDIRYNSTSSTIEFYTGSAWVGTNVAPSLNSITGDILNALSGRTLVINCNDISASGNDVKYSNNSTGATIATDSSASTSGSNITSTIPAAVYNTAAGTVIKIEVLNGAGVISSNSLTKTILASPSGGTITSAGGYRYHTFTSSGTFTNTIASLSVQYLVVAGGGGGGGNQGGGAGGAGGYRTGSATLGTGTYSASIGGGGSNGGNGNGGHGNDGGNSSFNSLTSTGGGGGVNMRTGGYHGQNGRSGGSGGGASHWMNGNFTGGSGTSGQGNDGGDARDTEGLGHNGGGGGGAGGSGSDGQGAYGGNGGNGSTWLNGTTYAGGGGGGCYYNNNSGGTPYSIGGGAGTGGGGRGSRNVGSQLSTNFTSPTTNQHGVDGYGGGGGGGGNQPGDGGDGVVIVRYAG